MSKLVLVVDDSATIREFAREILEEEGLTVVEAGDGKEGLKALDDNRSIELVITDHNMPNMKGLEMLGAMREKPHTKDLPVIMLTTESGDDVMSQAKKWGVASWVSKPFKPDRLMAAVNKVLKAKV